MNVVSDEVKILHIISDGISLGFRWKLKGLRVTREHFQQGTLALCNLEDIIQLSSGKSMDRVIPLRKNMTKTQARVVSFLWFLCNSLVNLFLSPQPCL